MASFMLSLSSLRSRFDRQLDETRERTAVPAKHERENGRYRTLPGNVRIAYCSCRVRWATPRFSHGCDRLRSVLLGLRGPDNSRHHKHTCFISFSEQWLDRVPSGFDVQVLGQGRCRLVFDRGKTISTTGRDLCAYEKQSCCEAISISVSFRCECVGAGWCLGILAFQTSVRPPFINPLFIVSSLSGVDGSLRFRYI